MLDEDTKAALARELDNVLGADITNLGNAIEAENELLLRRNHLQSKLNLATDLAPSKLSAAVKKAESSSRKVESLKQKSEEFKSKVGAFLTRTEPIRNELSMRFAAIERLDEVLSYLRSLEKVEDLNRQLSACADDEQAVLLYGHLQELSAVYTQGHRAAYLSDVSRHWHAVLKERLTKQYDDVLKALKWPFTSGQATPAPPREVLSKFNNLTKFLLLIQERRPTTLASGDTECEPSLPVRLLLRPLKKRFAFHFTGSRQTARVDRPEWFLTQTLTWIKEHRSFIRAHVQPVAENLQIEGVRAEEEFNAGLVSLAAERLHAVLGLYGSRGPEAGADTGALDADAALAHAIDEALGFQRELCAVTGRESGAVLAVLTRAETFVRWLAVEKKYALAKMDETLSTEQWMEPVAAGVEAATGEVLWVPRGADWFISLLRTIEDRYSGLPQPGHRLQFLELQLELLEEWRIRLTQLMSASYSTLDSNSLLAPDSTPHPLTAVINVAHHTQMVLLQWAHSLHYLQLHYYRRQFQHFTELQGAGAATESDCLPEPCSALSPLGGDGQTAPGNNESNLSLTEVEAIANRLALSEVTRRDSAPPDLSQLSTTRESGGGEGDDVEESGVFGELPALLLRLRDSGLTSLADHMLLEFKAALRDYKKQKWHAMCAVEEMALSVSPSLCRPLAALCARLHATRVRLAPTLYAKLRARIASELDLYLFEEVVLESWWNVGGAAQFSHDVRRNLVPVFAPPGKPTAHNLPRLCAACKLLSLGHSEAHALRSALARQPPDAALLEAGVRHVTPREALQILSQRTDLSDARAAVMEYF